MTVISSDDHKLRLYSWDTRMGGSMRMYFDLVQYQAGSGIKVVDMRDPKAEEDYGCDYTSITTVLTKNNKTVYLVIGSATVSTKDRYEGIQAFTIEGTSLKKINIFQAKTKTLNSIGYGYDAFASPQGSFVGEIHLSKDTKKLYIPIVKGEILTDNYLVYVFDGNNYVFDKNAK